MERITARYFIETPLDVAAAANVLAGEQSSGTFVAVPGETAALKQRFAANVTSVTHLGSVQTPAIPGAATERAFITGHISKFPGPLKISNITCRYWFPRYWATCLS